MTLMKVSNDTCELQRTKHKISVITQHAKKTKQLTIFFSLLTMPPQGQTLLQGPGPGPGLRWQGPGQGQGLESQGQLGPGPGLKFCP